MASTYSPNLRIELIGYGEQNNTWGTTTNTNLGTLIEQAIAGKAAVDVTAGNVTLTAVDGATDQSRQMILAITGTPGVARTVTAPSVSKVYVVANGSNATITIKMATGTGVTVSSGKAKFVYCDGTDFYEATTEQASAVITNLTVSGTLTASGTITGTGFSTYLASPPAIGSTTASTGQFTDLTSTGNTILGNAAADTVTINGTMQPGVVISGSSSSDALRITQTGTGNALVVEDSTNPDSTPFAVNTDGKTIVGHTTALATVAYTGAALTPNLQTQGVGMGASAFGVTNWANNTQSPAAIVLSKSKSNILGTPGVVASGDVLGSLSFTGDDGTAFINAAAIRAEVDGTPGINDMPCRLLFNTTADGTSSSTERMRIDNAGQVGFGGVPAAGRAVVAGKNITGSTTSRGITSVGQIQSDVTSTASYFATSVSTVPSAFTLTTLQHYIAIQGAIGAGSSVTNQYGFIAESSLTGATNNYGFYSNIASGTGRYNFYAAGTADNYFAGAIKGNTTIAGGYTAHAAGTAAMALGSNTVVKVTPNATATFTTTVAPAGAIASIIIVTSGTTSYTITFGTGFLTTGTLATGAVTAKTFVVNFVSDGTTMIETSRTVAM